MARRGGLQRPTASRETDVLQAYRFNKSRTNHEEDIGNSENSYAGQESAFRRRIMKTTYSRTPSVVNQLAEDDPDAHPKVQALTRLAEPSVSVLLLFQNAAGSAWSLDKAGLQHVVDRTCEPSLSAIRPLMKNVVTLSHRACVAHLKFEDGGFELPAAWREHSLLKYHSLVLLDADGVFRFPNYLLSWDDELGIVVDPHDPKNPGVH